MNLLSRVNYASITAYSPRGPSAEAKQSRQLVWRIKGGDTQLLARVVNEKVLPRAGEFEGFLGPDNILVPTPRSSPRVPNGYWPSLAICEALRDAGLGLGVWTLLRRTVSVRRSATAALGGRPTATQHLPTLVCEAELLPNGTITLVDDVITLGNTLLASATLVDKQYPDRDVRCFALARTLGLRDDIEKVIDPFTEGVIRGSGGSAQRMDR